VCGKAEVKKTKVNDRKSKHKFCLDKSKGKVVLEIFFDVQGLVRCQFIAVGRTVNKGM
jgi:hypothetical protein